LHLKDPKKTVSDLALPLHVAGELLKKCSHRVNLLQYTKKYTILLLMKIIITTFSYYNQAFHTFYLDLPHTVDAVLGSCGPQRLLNSDKRH
jgi:hypothetical protein